MGKFGVLLWLNLKAMLFSLRVGGGKKRAFTGVGAMLLMGGLALYLSGTYSFLFAAQLRRVDMLPLLIMMMPVLFLLAGFFFTVFAAQGVVFGGKDNDLMLALPVSSFTLLLSRLTALYLENLVFGIFVMLPAGVAYLVYGGGGGARFLLHLLVGTVLLALLPTLLALVVGFVLGWLSARFARRNFLTLLLYGVLLGALLIFSFKASFLLQDLAEQAAGVESALRSWAVPFVLLKEAACDGNLLSLLLLAALCLGPLLIVSAVFAHWYRPILTALGSRSSRAGRPMGRVRARGVGGALLKKEVARLFSTPIYLFNAGMGLILLLVGAMAALVQRDQVRALLDQVSGLGELPILPLLAAVLGFMLATVTLSASAVSLEGRYLWILKEAPISARRILLVKAGFPLLLTLPCVAAGCVCAGIGFGLRPGEGLLLLLLGVAFSLFGAPFGLLVNLYLPKLDAPNDMVTVKQSAAVLVAILGGVVVLGLGAGLYVLTRALLLVLPLTALLAGLAWVWLLRRGPALFDAL